MINLIDVIITTNSPGEVSAWVRPVVDELNKRDIQKNIYVFTPPCVFSSGNEGKVLSNIEGVTNTFNKKEYLKYILLNKKPTNFIPFKKGFVLFLGGDLMHAVFLGKKLGYPVYSYTENGFGFKNSIDKFYLSDNNLYNRLKNKVSNRNKLKVVGNLMYDSIKPKLTKEETIKLLNKEDNELLINLLPGSRPKGFKYILPLYINFVGKIGKKNQNIKFILSKSPFIVENYFKNILNNKRINEKVEYIKEENKLLVNDDIEIKIFDKNLHSIMKETDLAITIPGTNNLELSVLKTPMLVIFPLNKPELVPLQGLVGLIGEIPILGKYLKRKVIPKKVDETRFISLVNRIEGELIVPEFIGKIDSDDLAEKVLNMINNNEIEVIQNSLKSLDHNKGASKVIIDDIMKEMNEMN